jgi:hypothetical protein
MTLKAKVVIITVMSLSLGAFWTAWGESTSVEKKSKGRVPREKEAEGTQAPNRFNSDNSIKSKYELNGEVLEVDPD